MPVRFVELDVFGVYVAPIAAMMLAAYLALMPLRWLALRSGLLRRVWHPALFQIAVYLAILSGLVLGIDAVGLSTLVARP